MKRFINDSVRPGRAGRVGAGSYHEPGSFRSRRIPGTRSGSGSFADGILLSAYAVFVGASQGKLLRNSPLEDGSCFFYNKSGLQNIEREISIFYGEKFLV